jgi:hypothetical protein
MRSALCAGSCTSGHFRPYSPECVEEEFYEVRGSNLPRVAPSLMVSGWGRATF